MGYQVWLKASAIPPVATVTSGAPMTASCSSQPLDYCLKLTCEGGNSPYAPGATVWRLADVLNGEPIFVKDGKETENNGAIGFHPNFNRGDLLANYCAGQTWGAVVLDKFPEYSFLVQGTFNWGIAGSCTGTETADILEVLRGQRDSITTAFRARTNTYGAAHRNVKIEVVRDVMECGGRFYSDALFSKTESEQCAIMEAVLPKRDVCTLGTMTAGGRGERSALLDKKYFKFDDQTAYDDYASAGSQYWHNGLGRTTYVSQTSSWPGGCMNACCANPACQSFMFYKSECTLYSVATAAGMDDILGHESRQGPWGIDTGGPGYSIGFWEMSRQPRSECKGEHESSLGENNFNDRGNGNLNWQTTYVYTLYNGYSCALSGWTHTRDYAKGFLTNAAGTNPNAKISGLTPNQEYKYLIYQFASSFAGTNGFTAPGANEIETTTNTNDEPTASGTFISDSNGEHFFNSVGWHITS